MARPAGLEPATPGLGNRCSILLSYGRKRETQHSIAAFRLTAAEAVRIVGATAGMFKSPFVWEVQVRREVLEEEISRLRELPYSLWEQLLSRPMTKRTRGRDNRAYRVRTTAKRMDSDSEHIRVTVVLESGALHRHLMRQSFVITPDNHFTD